MLSLNKPIAFVDFETTGVDILKDRIVQAAITKFYPNVAEPEIWNAYINPGMPIPKEATEIHGITDEDVRMSPRFHDVALQITGLLGGCDIAGFNIISFDLPLLFEELARVNVDLDITKVSIVDVYRIFQKMRPHSLEEAYRQFIGEEIQGAHDAAADNQAAAEVFGSMMLKDPQVGNSVADWEAYYINRDEMMDLAGKFIYDGNEAGRAQFNFGKFEGQTVDLNNTDHVQYLEWMNKSEFPRDTKLWIRQIIESQQAQN